MSIDIPRKVQSFVTFMRWLFLSMYTRSLCMKIFVKLYYIITIFFLVSCISNEKYTYLKPNSEGFFFCIENGNKDNYCFSPTGYKEIGDFIISIVPTSETVLLPFCLYNTDNFQDDGVVQLVLNFALDKKYKMVWLEISRAGSETTIVKIDNRDQYLVTREMLGSSDGGIVGSYRLDLEALEAGDHILKFSVANDGKGNGGYHWQRIALRTNEI